MNKEKKLIAIIAVLILVILLLVAALCGLLIKGCTNADIQP